MFQRLSSVAFRGLEALLVEVEVDIVPSEERLIFQIVGLPDSAIKESRERIISALRHADISLAGLQITVNLAPSDLKKEGTLFDLPIALAIAAAMKKWKPNFDLSRALIVGELGLQGDVRPMKGALGAVLLAKQNGHTSVILPFLNQPDLAVVPGVELILATDLKSVLKGEKPLFIPPILPEKEEQWIDFEEIVGQQMGKRALEISAAGGHNLLMKGPPGTGKSLLAKSLPSILPALDPQSSLDVKRIWSLAGLLTEGKRPPFRSPHHTVSHIGLIGGGARPRPGEISLAHHGVLFLDELPEFTRQALEILRQPLEDHQVTITRAEGSLTFPARFVCVAAMNPCPCGFYGHPDRRCVDTTKEIERYQKKISGPLLDRFDLQVEIPPLTFQEMGGRGKESSRVVKERIIKARKRQEARNGVARLNSQLTSKEVKEKVALNSSQEAILEEAVNALQMSMRSLQRLLKVTRTIADLEESDAILDDHLLEAISYRTR